MIDSQQLILKSLGFSQWKLKLPSSGSSPLAGNCRLVSRMREIRTSGSKGKVPNQGISDTMN